MSERFERYVPVVLGVEGGFVNDPQDPGGPTNLGITEPTLRAAQARGVVAFRTTIKTLTVEQAKEIYRRFYWIDSRAPEFPEPLDLLLFDAYVNHRPRAAVRLVQAALGVGQDGQVGEITLAAARRAAKDGRLVEVVKAYRAARESLYGRIVAEDRTQRKFLKGWFNRVARLEQEALRILGAAA